jgi:hypothetical protein
MSLLVRTPSPHATESLLGLVLRVSEANGYDTPWHVLRLAGIDQGQMQTAGLPVGKLAQIMNRSADTLRNLAYQANTGSSSHFKILNHPLGQSLRQAPLRLRQPAICPQCVQEDGYIDAFWDLSAAIACPKHNCQAMRHCPGCGNAIRWFRPGLLACNCGASFAESALPTADQPVVELMAIIQAKLHGRSLSKQSNMSGFPLALLEPIPLNSFLFVLETLGAQNLQSMGKQTPKNRSLVAEAIAPLEQWPAGYHRFLMRLGDKLLAENAPAVGLRKQFEPFYQAMFRNRSFSKNASFLRDEFITFGLVTWGSAVVDRKLLRTPKPISEQRFISKSEFARRFGIWKPVMDRMIANGTVVVKKVSAGKSTRLVVDLEQSQPPVKSTRIVTDREAARYLGLPVSVLNHLRDIGIYSTKPRVGYEQSWHKDDLEEFLTRGLALGRGIHVPSESSIALERAMRLILRDAKAKADIVVAIFDGRLPVIGRIGDNLSGLLLDKTLLDQFVHLKRVALDDNSYSFTDAAERTGLDVMAIDNAIATGLLTEVDCDGRRRVPVGAVERFNIAYVTLSHLAQELNTLAQHLLRACQQCRIPVILLARSNGQSGQPILVRTFEPELRRIWRAHSEQRDKRKMKRASKDRQSQYENTLRTYLEGIRKLGKQLVRRAGSPNKVMIARECGFPRDVLYDYPTVIKLLDDFDGDERKRPGGECLNAVGALKAYLTKLRERGEPLPRYKGSQPNKLVIARACGFHRHVLYTNAEAMTLLKNAFDSDRPS